MKPDDDENSSSRRARGIVWVCDIESSTKYLNDNTTAGDLERFLPRLNQIASTLVSSAGGTFVKWTGDGFLAWFETPLHRDTPGAAATVFAAIYHLTLIVNVTQLDTKPLKKFKLRHAVTYEKDALVTSTRHSGRSPTIDIIGRDVVLAFRLSGISASFPGISTQKELVEAYFEAGGKILNFKQMKPSPEDLLKYFKGETRGTKSIYLSSTESRSRKASRRAVLKVAQTAIAAAEKQDESSDEQDPMLSEFTRSFASGAEWRRRTLEQYSDFVKNTLLEALKTAVRALESSASTKPAGTLAQRNEPERTAIRKTSPKEAKKQ